MKKQVRDIYEQNHSEQLIKEAQVSLTDIAASLGVTRAEGETVQRWHDRIETAAHSRMLEEQLVLEDIRLHREILGTRFVSARKLIERAQAVEFMAARAGGLTKRRAALRSVR